MESAEDSNRDDYSDIDLSVKSNGSSTISFQDTNGNKCNFNFKIGNDVPIQIDEFCKKNNYSKNIKEIIENKIQKKIQDKMKFLEEDNSEEEWELLKNENNESSKKYDTVKSESKNSLIESNESLTSQYKIYSIANYKEFKNKKEKIKKKKNVSVDTIYERGMAFYEQKKKKVEEYNEKKSKIRYPFKPKVNNYKKILNKSSDNIRNGHLQLSVEDRLIMLGNMSKLKKSKIIQLYYQKDFDDNNYTFTPKINKYKRKNKNNNKNIFISLYENAEEIKQKVNNKREQLFKKFTFQPKINQNSKNMEITTFNTILSDNKKCLNDEIIIKPPKEITKKKSNFKFENEKIKNDILIKPKESKEVNIKKKKWMKYINQKIEDQKIKTYKNIFDILDLNKNNFISYQTIDTSKLNKKLFSIISPILNQIIENKEEMVTFKEFTERADKIIPQKMFKTKKI